VAIALDEHRWFAHWTSLPRGCSRSLQPAPA
jgi:hypothetical protein